MIKETTNTKEPRGSRIKKMKMFCSGTFLSLISSFTPFQMITVSNLLVLRQVLFAVYF